MTNRRSTRRPSPPPEPRDRRGDGALPGALDRPRFSEAEAERLASRMYGITATARPLPSERDQNVHLTSADGRIYVLKIAGAAESESILDLQNRALAYLGDRAGSDRVPRVFPTRTGEALGRVTGRGGRRHLVRLLSFVPGLPLAVVAPHSPPLLRAVGRALGRMDQVLRSFRHPAMHRTLKWDMRYAPDTIRRHLVFVEAPERRALVEHLLVQVDGRVAPRLPNLRSSVIHNDANDYNVIVLNPASDDPPQIGFIDFGDMLYGATVCEPAIAAAYVMLDHPRPLAAAAALVEGYHASCALTEPEIALLFPLLCARLCLSVTIAAEQQATDPENDYLGVSEAKAWRLLERLAAVPPARAHYLFRAACGLPPVPQTPHIVAWLRENPDRIGPVVEPPLDAATARVLDLSVGSSEFEAPGLPPAGEALADHVAALLKESGTSVGIGRYDEARLLYRADAFGIEGRDPGARRTIHLGMDLFLPSGSPVRAPLDGTVHSFQDNVGEQDYGPTLILRHAPAAGILFYTLYGHLSRDSLPPLQRGRDVARGTPIGRVGAMSENGGWPSHLHFQIITDLLGQEGTFPGVADESERGIWRALSPDPNLLLTLPATLFPPAPRDAAEILIARRRRLGPSLSLSYRRPLKIVRGWRQHLIDDRGRWYLDGVNNVAHVGHNHPHVVRAARRQNAVLNTNSRYLHDHLVEYAERLTATLPDPLSVCYLVCTGSEANELALRLARTWSGRRDMLVLDGAYHGNTSETIAISPYKFNGAGGGGAPPYVHVLPMPDPYRGPYGPTDRAAGPKYAAAARETLDVLARSGRGIAGFIGESVLGCGGQIVLPPEYLERLYHHVRAAGGLCIADEVQVGFGRVGTHFWGFETQGVVPDIVTMGKPIGNGHPLAAVVTTREIADAFANGMEYFNTFGGNPVSCAVGMAVLDVIEQEQLQQQALEVGRALLQGLSSLAERHPLIGDVRGVGLFLGIELVNDRRSKRPAVAQAGYIVERMKEEGILLSTDGPLHNVIKIKPPLVFDRRDAARLVATLDRILAEDRARPRRKA